MALYSKLLGVVGTSFAIGVSGVAASGALRVTNNVTALAARNAAGSGDLSLVGTDGSNNLLLGDTNTASILFGPASIGWAAGVAAPTITQTALASTSGGSGAAGQALTVSAQAGQAATGASNNGGAGGNLVLACGAGGTSGSATAGAAGVIQLKVATNIAAQFGAWIGGATVNALYMSYNPTGSFIPTSGNYALLATASNLYVGGSNNLFLTVGGNAGVRQTMNGSGLQIGSSTVSFAGGVNVVGITNATTDPSANPSGGAVWWSSLTVGASKQRTSSGWTKTTAGNCATTVNSQKLVYDELIATGQITAAGGTVTLTVPLPTSNTGVRIACEVDARVVTAGTLVAVGDSYSTYVRVKYKNVAGTLTVPAAGATVVVDTYADTHLSTSTVAFSVSGTNIVITLTLNPTSGTLPAADCTILARCFYN